ncbi:hypothetical protein RA27_18015 [Ruegeria sp. ANG-R]|uniref:BatD family protein n=1 Tax=Ruegeria sp. ANG-R TaxID=1577903 RepID=UPI00057D54FB|nr:BatD family protein [Ruegeria sp. ANG-R]KIC39049.1 hypothetical protein RA27_18015 [Ruegeria sp. ANG-R]
MKYVIKSSIAAALIGIAVASGAYADGLLARVNTTQVAEGDQLQLVLTADGQGGAAPDLSPLSTDFNMLGTSQSSQTQIINGRTSQSVSWIVTLSPKTKGQLTIPSLSAGTLTSDPITLNVVDASQLPKSQGAGGISVAATIDDGSHYVFQEIPLTVRIETQVPLQRAELIAPNGDFELTQTGQDRSSQITRNGQPVNVIERSYLLRPQTEGTLTLAPFTLRGTVADPNARRDPFADFGFGSSMMQQMMQGSPFGSMFNSGKPFSARSDAITLDVLANPGTGTSGWFLPAKAVQIEAAWQPENPSFREGEAVTRRISLLALGARPEQLPDLTFAEPDGARLYLDDTQTEMVPTADGTVARRDFQISVVPTRGGQVTLPEISVEWLNTETDQTETATLPALSIEVEGSVPVSGAASTGPADTDVAAVPAQAATAMPMSRLWAGALAVVFAAFGIFVWYWRKTRSSNTAEKFEDQTLTLRRCAHSGDQAGFYQALLALKANPGQADPAELGEVIAEFERLAFARDAKGARPDLNAMLKRVLPRKTSGAIKPFKKQKHLAPLYPAS